MKTHYYDNWLDSVIAGFYLSAMRPGGACVRILFLVGMFLGASLAIILATH